MGAAGKKALHGNKLPHGGIRQTFSPPCTAAFTGGAPDQFPDLPFHSPDAGDGERKRWRPDNPNGERLKA